MKAECRGYDVSARLILNLNAEKQSFLKQQIGSMSALGATKRFALPPDCIHETSERKGRVECPMLRFPISTTITL